MTIEPLVKSVEREFSDQEGSSLVYFSLLYCVQILSLFKLVKAAKSVIFPTSYYECMDI